jgi:hypothetical protein
MTEAKKPAAETANPEPPNPAPAPEKPKKVEEKVVEIGGPPGPEPTRYGDWQFNGKVTDF